MNHTAAAITSIAYYANLVDQTSLGFPSSERNIQLQSLTNYGILGHYDC